MPGGYLVRKLRYLLPILGLVGLAVAVPASATVPPTYYVALGDSLSVGYQPAHAGQPVAGDTNQGYTDKLYAHLKLTHPSLVLIKLGCSGETTTTMLNGGICSYPAGSQEAQALAFLAAHGTAVKYITIDIGANDVDGCAPGGSIDEACIAKGLATIGTNLETILKNIQAVDGGLPQSVGMAYYDPFLAFWLTGATGQVTARASVGLLAGLNTELASLFAAHQFKGADVANTFHTGNFAQVQNYPPYGRLPLNVRTICTYTYMCSLNNIHANPAGYQLIANTFAAQVH